MDLIEDIGPLLGILAFLGLAGLVLLLIPQAREVNRLREWAGRAPERAILIAEREAEERGVAERSRFAGMRAWLSRTYARIDQTSPVDPRFGLGFLAALAVAAVLLTTVFGVIGGDPETEGSGEQASAIDRSAVRVAVLNGTATPVSPAVPELAARVARKVRKAGYKLGVVTNGESVPKSVAMFRRNQREQAEQLVVDVRPFLGKVSAQRMTDAVVGQARGADVALVIGADDSRL